MEPGDQAILAFVQRIVADPGFKPHVFLFEPANGGDVLIASRATPGQPENLPCNAARVRALAARGYLRRLPQMPNHFTLPTDR